MKRTVALDGPTIELPRSVADDGHTATYTRIWEEQCVIADRETSETKYSAFVAYGGVGYVIGLGAFLAPPDRPRPEFGLDVPRLPSGDERFERLYRGILRILNDENWVGAAESTGWTITTLKWLAWQSTEVIFTDWFFRGGKGW